MCRRKLNSDYQNVDQSENQGRQSRSSRQTPIACIVCDMVFFNNVNLVLHFFECHHRGENSIPGQHGRGLGFLCSRSPYFSPYVERTNAAHHTSQRVNNCFRPSPCPVSSAIPDLAPREANPFGVPVLNSMPPMISSSGARFNVPQPMHRSVMIGTSLYGSTSSSTHPMYSQLGPRTFSYGPKAAPDLRLREQNAIQARVSNPRIPHNNQRREPVPIVLTDSEEEVNSSAEEIDLTLRI